MDFFTLGGHGDPAEATNCTDETSKLSLTWFSYSLPCGFVCIQSGNCGLLACIAAWSATFGARQP